MAKPFKVQEASDAQPTTPHEVPSPTNIGEEKFTPDAVPSTEDEMPWPPATPEDPHPWQHTPPGHRPFRVK